MLSSPTKRVRSGQHHRTDIEVIIITTKLIEPPRFITETKLIETNGRELKNWTLMADMEPKLQVIVITYYLDCGIAENNLKHNNCIASLLQFLAKIYKKDNLCGAFDCYKDFKKIRRKP